MDCYDKLNSFEDYYLHNIHLKLHEINYNGTFAVQRGFYIDQIKYILSLFDRSNLLILISEEVKENYKKIYQFLEISDIIY